MRNQSSVLLGLTIVENNQYLLISDDEVYTFAVACIPNIYKHVILVKVLN